MNIISAYPKTAKTFFLLVYISFILMFLALTAKVSAQVPPCNDIGFSPQPCIWDRIDVKTSAAGTPLPQGQVLQAATPLNPAWRDVPSDVVISGNLGVNTGSAPAYRLQVVGTGQITSTLSLPYNTGRTINGANGSGIYLNYSGDNNMYVDSASGMVFRTGGGASNLAVLNSSGDLSLTRNLSATSVSATNHYFAGNTAYGFIGANVYADTLNSGASTDPLELVYYGGSDVRIGTPSAPKPIYASQMVDYNSTGYYVDPASANSFNTTYGNNFISRDNGQGNIYLSTSAGSLPGYPTLYYPTLRSDTGVIYLSAGGGYSGYIANDGIRSPKFWDFNRETYYVDPDGNTQLNELYVNSWIRPQNCNGIYQQSYGLYFWPVDCNSDYWGMRSGYGLKMQDNGSNTKGYLYFDSSGFGLRNQNGGWAVRIGPSGGQELYGTTYIGGSNQIFKYSDVANPIVTTSRSDGTQQGVFGTDGWGKFTFSRSISAGGTGFTSADDGGEVNATHFHSTRNDSWLPYPGNNYNYFRGTTYAFNSIWRDETNPTYSIDPSETTNLNALQLNGRRTQVVASFDTSSYGGLMNEQEDRYFPFSSVLGFTFSQVTGVQITQYSQQGTNEGGNDSYGGTAKVYYVDGSGVYIHALGGGCRITYPCKRFFVTVTGY